VVLVLVCDRKEGAIASWLVGFRCWQSTLEESGAAVEAGAGGTAGAGAAVEAGAARQQVPAERMPAEKPVERPVERPAERMPAEKPVARPAPPTPAPPARSPNP
jgi:hypothetical protein